MVFSEIYGTYFNTVAAILREAGERPVSEKRMREIVQEKAFGESMMTIPDALLDGRCMLYFSDFEKKTERLDDKHYRFLLRYEEEDETEVLIRILSFGPRLRVTAPESFIEKIKERLERQKSCGF